MECFSHGHGQRRCHGYVHAARHHLREISSPLASPEQASANDINLDDLDRTYDRYRRCAIYAVVFSGIKEAFEKIPDLETVTVDVSHDILLRPLIRSNPDRSAYEHNMGSAIHKRTPGYKRDRCFDRLFSQTRKRLGGATAARAAMRYLVDTSSSLHVSITRFNHLPLMDCLLSAFLKDPSALPGQWNMESMALADAIAMDRNAPSPTTTGKGLRL